MEMDQKAAGVALNFNFSEKKRYCKYNIWNCKEV